MTMHTKSNLFVFSDLALFAAVSCSGGGRHNESVAITSSALGAPQGIYELVTGAQTSDPTFNFEQAETAVAVALKDAHTAFGIITYNDGTEPSSNITYTTGAEGTPASGTREIYNGASLMGYSWVQYDPTLRYPTVGSTAWTYLAGGTGKPRPPAGWSLVWGDPSITVSQTDSSLVFIANV